MVDELTGSGHHITITGQILTDQVLSNGFLQRLLQLGPVNINNNRKEKEGGGRVSTVQAFL